MRVPIEKGLAIHLRRPFFALLPVIISRRCIKKAMYNNIAFGLFFYNEINQVTSIYPGSLPVFRLSIFHVMPLDSLQA